MQAKRGTSCVTVRRVQDSAQSVTTIFTPLDLLLADMLR